MKNGPANNLERWGSVTQIAVYLAVFSILLSPLLWIEIPVLVDYPNHLARMWVLSEIDISFSHAPAWKIMPNLAMELIVPPLIHIVPIEIAGKIFIVLSMLLPVIGSICIRRALWGRIGYTPLMTGFFVYNYVLYWGFLNYLFSLGCALVCFSVWITSQKWQPMARLAIFLVLANILFLFHLFAWGVYGLLVVSYELGRLSISNYKSPATYRTLLFAATQFVPAILFSVASVKNDPSHLSFYGSSANKFLALFSPMAFGDMGPMALAAGATLGAFCFAARGVSIHRDLRLPLLAMAITAVAMPFSVMGIYFADIRLPVALSFVAVAAIRLSLNSRRLVLALSAVSVAWLGVRVWSISESWRVLDKQYTEFRMASRIIPIGSRLLVVWSPIPEGGDVIGHVPKSLITRQGLEYLHLPAMLIIDRNPLIADVLFTGWSPIVSKSHSRNFIPPAEGKFLPASELTPRERSQSDSQSNDVRSATVERSYPHDWPSKFDYIISVDFGSRPILPMDRLRSVADGSFFQIYRVTTP